MTVKIYIAGASKEPARVRAMMDAVKEFGLEITLDWLATIKAEGAANEGLDDNKRRRYARADFDAVGNADWIWVLAPDLTSSSAGCWAELGYAQALFDVRSGALFPRRKGLGLHHPRIIVSGLGRVKCIFTSLVEREFDHDGEALAYLRDATEEA
jgi:hypothetical protein